MKLWKEGYTFLLGSYKIWAHWKDIFFYANVAIILSVSPLAATVHIKYMPWYTYISAAAGVAINFKTLFFAERKSLIYSAEMNLKIWPICIWRVNLGCVSSDVLKEVRKTILRFHYKTI